MDRWKLGGQLAATAMFGWGCWGLGYAAGERDRNDRDSEPEAEETTTIRLHTNGEQYTVEETP